MGLHPIKHGLVPALVYGRGGQLLKQLLALEYINNTPGLLDFKTTDKVAVVHADFAHRTMITIEQIYLW